MAKGRSLLIAGAAASTLAGATPAWTQAPGAEDEPGLTFAERDARALEAEHAAEAAWRAAEAQFGASPETARAAYDFARASLLAARLTEAREAAERLQALEAEAAEAGIARQTVRLAAAMAAFEAEQAGIAEVRELARAVDAAEKAAPRDDLLIGAGWLQVALGHWARGRAVDAYPAALSGRMTIAAAPEKPLLLEVVSADLLGRAALETARYDEAAESFFAAAAPFAPAPEGLGEGELPADWVMRATHAAAAGAAWRATGGEALSYPGHTPRVLAPAGCAPDWRRQRDPRLDRELEYLAGAALMEMNMDSRGRPQKIRTVAAVPPNGDLNEAAFEAVEDWRATEESAAACGGATIRALVEVFYD